MAKSAALFAVSSLKMPGTRVMTMVTMAAAMMTTEDDLGGFVVLLKDADHAWLTTFTSKRAVGRSRVPGIFAQNMRVSQWRRITPACRGFVLSINQRRRRHSAERSGLTDTC